MQKELIIATTPQETKIAILEDDELVEFQIERDRSQGIVGNIYKGKVTKVLPGMQSAFVDIGLDRDAFLYVSDFFEDTEEYDKIVSTVEDEVAQLQEAPAGPSARGGSSAPVPLPSHVSTPTPSHGTPSLATSIAAPETAVETQIPPSEPPAVRISMSAATTPDESVDRGSQRRRDRDRDRRGKKPRIPSFESKTFEQRPDERTFGSIEVLPGESLAKYARKAIETNESRQPKPAESDVPLADPAIEAASAPNPREVKESGISADVAPGTVAEETVTTASPLESNRPEVSSSPDEKAVSEPESQPTTQDQGPSSARIVDRSGDYKMAHRSANRRQRRRDPFPSAKHEETRTNGGQNRVGPMISELLREGQEILVQVSKEPLGKKGARITSHIALPGRYLVYMPTVDHVGVSRKIASDEERIRLKRIINEHRNGLPGGFIVRTAAEGRGEEDFVQDIRFLGKLWADIRAKGEKRAAPALIHRDLNLVQRMLRDQLNPDFRAIRLDNENEFATILDFVNKFQPALVNRVKLHLKDTPIFEEYGLNAEIDKALRPKVWLKSGGYIVINQTEALVAIDVNTGKFVGKSNRLEDTIVRTNVDAVHEIVRQIRLRNLGGIIVVDFIDMEEKKNRQRVMAALEEELRADRSPSKILQFNDFGLVAITRKRTHPSLERTLCTPCTHCNGSGWAKSAETICYDIQQEIKKMAHMLEGKEITVRVHPEIAKALKGGEFVSINEIEEWTKKDILVKSDPLLNEEHFDIF
jgi:ribonuclease G